MTNEGDHRGVHLLINVRFFKPSFGVPPLILSFVSTYVWTNDKLETCGAVYDNFTSLSIYQMMPCIIAWGKMSTSICYKDLIMVTNYKTKRNVFFKCSRFAIVIISKIDSVCLANVKDN